MDLKLPERSGEQPKLSDWLDEMIRQAGPDGKGRVRILDGAPERLRYTYKATCRKHVRAAVRYKNGKIIFQSNHVTDEILGAPVTHAKPNRSGWSVFVYIPRGRYHDRPGKQSAYQDAPITNTVQDPANTYDPYDELPFN